MTSKYAVKTYSRSIGRDTPASKAFDDIVTNKATGAQTVPIKTANTKWGKTQFSRVRDEDPFETTLNKVKIEIETEDPFTFGSDDIESSKKKVAKEDASSHGAGLGRPAISNMKSYTSERTRREDVPDVDKSHDQPTFKRPVRTYSRAAKKQQNAGDTTQMEQIADPDDNAEPDDDEMPVLEAEESSLVQPSNDSHSSSYDDEVAVEDPAIKADPYDNYDEDEDEEEAPQLLREAQRTYGRSARVASAAGKTHVLQSQSDDDQNPRATVLNFRSHFMDPAVYSRFSYVPPPEDPVGRLNNSKVLQRSEIKHGKGSTLIVICSPKPPTPGEAKTKLLHQKTTRDPYTRSNVVETPPHDSKVASSDSQEAVAPKEVAVDESSFEFSEESSATLATATQSSLSTSTTDSDTPGRRQYSSKKGVKRGRESLDKSVKYNKFFRSRNSAAMNEENDTKKNFITTSPIDQQAVVDNQENLERKKPKKKKPDVSLSFGFDEDVDSHDQQSVESSAEDTAEQESMDQEESEQMAPQSGGSQSDEDLDSSQNSQGQTSMETDSQDMETLPPPKLTKPKAKVKTVREKKIFKSKNKGEAQKKILRSPKKVD